jgi:putative DNA primase/helicase
MALQLVYGGLYATGGIMKLTFYRDNKITDKVVNGKVVDLTFSQLVFNFKFPILVDIKQEDLFKLKDSENENDRAQYLKLKDVGFFIGGEVDVESKSRRVDKILSRSVLTFDIDKPTEDIWKKFCSTFPSTQALCYSTISSNKSQPRYRMLVPLNRSVGSADYVNIMNYIIGILGSDSFDKTTTEVSRVMFFPSVCNDQENVFETNGTEPLNADYCLSQIEKVDGGAKISSAPEAVNPKEKRGVVGAFNRAFSITKAIESFLSNVYEIGYNSTPDSPRYKFKGSKSAPGARVYDNDTRFYSTHDKDPAALKNLDAFNLVKLHLFDNDFDKCREWALKLDEVKEEMKNDLVNENDVNDEWITHLYRDPKKGNLLCSPYNLQMILLNDENLACMFRVNTLTYMIEVCKDMEDIGGAKNRKFKTLEDADIIEVQIYLETSKFNIRATKQGVIDIVCQVARLNQYNPVAEYLEGLEDAWDGVERIPTMFTDYLMAKDTPIIRKVARKVMAAAVWRVMVPGIKWEGVPVLHGIQGCGKSTFIQKLYKSSMYDKEPKNWVNNTAIDYSNIDRAIQRTKGFWGIELAELASTTMNNFSNELMKAFISADRPVTRIPYDKFEVTLDRKCVFWGTTNTWFYISDLTGARRFIPIDCNAHTEEEKFECLQKINNMDADMLWAEVMSYYKTEKLYFTVDEEKELNILRNLHTEESSYEAIISKFTESKITIDWAEKSPMERRDFFQNNINNREAVVARETVSLSEIAYEALGKALSDVPRKALRDIEVVLYNLGWRIAPYPIKSIYGQSKTFIKSKGDKQ